MVWQPIVVGLTVSVLIRSRLGAVGHLGADSASLVTGLGVAAGLALINRRAGAVNLARAVLVVSAATDVFVYVTPYFPSNRGPGETPVFVAVSLVYYAVWIAYLSRSRRVRRTFANT